MATVDRINGLTGTLGFKAPVRAVATSNISSLSGYQTIGGVSFSSTTNPRVLLTAQTDASENGIYDQDSGDWTRSADFDGARDIVKGTMVGVTDGLEADYIWRVTSDDGVVVGVDDITFDRSFAGVDFSTGSPLIPAYVAGVMALDYTTVLDGTVLITDGYYSAGDGGAATYYVDKSDTTSVDDGGSVIVANDGTRVKLSLRGMFSVAAETFGAKFDGTTEDHVAIQNAIDFLASIGGGILLLPAGTSIIGATLLLPSAVILKGVGSAGTILKAKNGLNADIIQTDNWASQTGNNKWFVDTENVRYGSGLVGLSIDGNKANQSAGNGVNLYCKRAIIDDLFVRDCYDDGFTSECGKTVGQHDWRDNPEGFHGRIIARNNGGDGIILKGVHDTHWLDLIANANGGWGIQVLADGSNYDATCEIGHIHTYNNTSGGVNANTGFRCNAFIPEDGCVIAGTNTHITYSRLGLGSKTGYQMTVSAASCSFGMIRCTNTTSGQSGVKVTGDQCTVGSLYAFGTGSGTAIGLEIDASQFSCGNLIINSYSGASGIGMKVATSGTIYGVKVTGSISGCTSNMHFANEVVGGQFRIGSFNASSTAHFDPAQPTPLRVSRNAADIWCGTTGGVVHKFYGAARGLIGHEALTDAAKTLVVGLQTETQVLDTSISGNRTLTLSTTAAHAGAKFHIVRTANATGAFNLNVGTGPLKALGIGTWCDVEFDGTAWFLSRYGAL